ncbi:MAG: type II toxin-antitoxin system Phd/YefM family antitoxin [Acidobacteriota bacterium]
MKRAAFSPETDWQLQTAKARFSELFRKARTEGPQRITRMGKEAVVVIPLEEYEKLTAKPAQQKSLWQILRESPLVGLELDFERNKSLTRDLEL